ncbi:hypothetical protein E2C01_087914 [Portunus trituberculatus]|uniref:Transmembrane protein n=1 Tax=Portunus trituberculatus TaxID=210409 RepID=A0A5B7JFB9_PORTR|nr:hypothetical protein [Portunus trituberculatus]
MRECVTCCQQLFADPRSGQMVRPCYLLRRYSAFNFVTCFFGRVVWMLFQFRWCWAYLSSLRLVFVIAVRQPCRSQVKHPLPLGQPSPPSSRAYNRPPPVPGTDVRLHNMDDSSRRHSSRRSCGRRNSVRLRDNADDAHGSRHTSPVPLPWSVVLDALADLQGEVEASKADRQWLPPSARSALAPVGDSTLGAPVAFLLSCHLFGFLG